MNNQYGKTDAIQDLKILGLSPSSFVDEQKLQASEEISSIYENLINTQFRKLARTNRIVVVILSISTDIKCKR